MSLNIIRFTGGDEVFVLALSIDSKGSTKFIDGLDDISTILSELIPINEGILPDNLQQRVCILLDLLDSDLTHVETISD